MTELRESGAIEADANQIWLLYNPEADPLTRDQGLEPELIVAKNRDGPSPTLPLQFNAEAVSFVDPVAPVSVPAPTAVA